MSDINYGLMAYVECVYKKINAYIMLQRYLEMLFCFELKDSNSAVVAHSYF